MPASKLDFQLLSALIASDPHILPKGDASLGHVTPEDFHYIQALVQTGLPYEDKIYQDFVAMLTASHGSALRAQESPQQRQRSKKRRKGAA